MKSVFVKVFIYLLFTFRFVAGQNPIIGNIGISDPHARVFNDTLYLFTGHDDHPGDSTWVMRDWLIFSTTDLVNWKIEGDISPKDNYMDDNSTSCWASDAIDRNGKYYFYFSNHKNNIGVMVANSPKGPFKDALGKPLVSWFDPTILIDDDQQKTPYIVYGDKAESYHIARLNNDMISLAETPRAIQITGEEWKTAPSWMDKNYIFKRNGIYYLVWAYGYATSKNVYGPYECRGVAGKGHNLDAFAHGSFFEWQGQFYHIWCHYIKVGRKYRETVISYCHFDDQGNIKTDTRFLDKHYAYGVGRYEAVWDTIEAEWFTARSKELVKKECVEGGFEVANIGNQSWLKFSKVDFKNAGNIFSARLSNVNPGVTMEIRQDSITGPLLGKMKLAESASERDFIKVNLAYKKPVGTKDIYLRFEGNINKKLHLNWISFNQKK